LHLNLNRLNLKRLNLKRYLSVASFAVSIVTGGFVALRMGAFTMLIIAFVHFSLPQVRSDAGMFSTGCLKLITFFKN
jgi:hypothetical protein